MTFKEVKQLIRFQLSNDKSISEEDMPLLVFMALKEVAHLCVPLTLLRSGLSSQKLLRYVDDVNYIRVPNAPINDIDIIDIDELLIPALIFCVCKNASLMNKSMFETMMLQSINNYQWAIYEGETNVVSVNS